MEYGGGSVARRPTARWWTVTTVVLAVAVEICCAAMVWFVASDGDFGYLALTICALLALAVLWSIFALFGAIRYRAYLLSAVAPALVLVAFTAVYSDTAERVGWLVSKGSLEAAARECAPSSEPHRIGVYTIERIRPAEGGADRAGTECRFHTGGGFMNEVGFAYLPDGPPPDHSSSETTYRPYDGSWYRFVISW
ncbi:hypothetical protein [Nocardia sp. NPDC003963]